MEEFVVRHGTALLRIAVGVCRDRTAAEDLVQDTLLRLLPRELDRLDQPLAYARTVMIRLHLDQSARGRPTERMIDLEAPDAYAEVDSLDTAVAMVRHLPPRARAVLTLRYIEDLGDREIAEILGVSRSTVRVTAHRALRALSVSSDHPDLTPPRRL